MKLEKFINKLDNGEIKDLKPYIEKENIDILLEIARRGLEVDYLLKRGELEVIETLINNGYASEYYDFWKHHSKQSIRETLAKNTNHISIVCIEQSIMGELLVCRYHT